LISLLIFVFLLTSCAPGRATTPPTATMTVEPTATAAPTITPTPTPITLADSPGLPGWVEEYVHAYGGKVTVNGVQMDAEQLTAAIRQNPEAFIQKKPVNGIVNSFLIINGVPLAVREDNSNWQNASMKTMGNLAGLALGTLLDDTPALLHWWGDEYTIGTSCLSMTGTMPDRTGINFEWPNYQARIARENGLTTRMQAALFPGDMPAWMDAGFTQSDLDLIVRLFMENARENNIDELVVVNETGAPDERRDLYWEKFGETYVIRAYQLAREIYPQAKLIYNDANNHRKGYITTLSTLKIANDLYTLGLVDYVGVEMHIDSSNIPTKQELIDVFRSYPVPVMITEFDALLTDYPEDQREDKLNQITKTVFDGCMESGVCQSISTWGTNEGVNWDGKHSVLRDKENRPHQAYYIAIQSMFEHLP
ncbi:MAG TPA: endo-1,4-beta-xylanase, partial [Anaerolineaceae bacterium]|nr:endo-1,4-beta-xylanase [Anaerolineaceae bacterium]